MENIPDTVDLGNDPSEVAAAPTATAAESESEPAHDIQPELQAEARQVPAPEPIVADAAQPEPVPTPPQEVAVTNADCLCWPHSKESLKEPQPPETILPHVWKLVGLAVQDINAIIARLRLLSSSPPAPAPDAESSTTLSALGRNVANQFGLAVMLICQAPGYLFPTPRCRNTFPQHLVYLSRRDDTLRTVEETLKQTLADAQPLIEAREKFMKIEATRRRRRTPDISPKCLIQSPNILQCGGPYTWRSARRYGHSPAAIAMLPFAPVFSATLTGLDTVVLAVFFGAEDIIVPEAELRSTSESVDTLMKEMAEKIGMVEELRNEIGLIRQKVTTQETDPAATRLYQLVLKLQEAQDRAEMVLEGKESKDGRSAASPVPLSVRDLVIVVQEAADVLGERPADVPSLVEVDSSEWPALDEALKMQRTPQGVSSAA
ncbi:hypothetical protein BC628DRAFT_1339511 [Trametes gibbosa]|nr:hypothetical protein BC628DRAFT_1339511 [Trametes gibbosa]